VGPRVEGAAARVVAGSIDKRTTMLAGGFRCDWLWRLVLGHTGKVAIGICTSRERV